jgi:hypothetical protein
VPWNFNTCNVRPPSPFAAPPPRLAPPLFAGLGAREDAWPPRGGTPRLSRLLLAKGCWLLLPCSQSSSPSEFAFPTTPSHHRRCHPTPPTGPTPPLLPPTV